MNTTHKKVEFSISGKAKNSNQDLSPSSIDMRELGFFLKNIGDLIQGDIKEELVLSPEIEKGSVKLAVLLPFAVAVGLEGDLSLAQEGRLSELPPARSKALQKIQKQLEKHDGGRISLPSSKGKWTIDKKTQLNRSPEFWVPVQRQFTGVIENMGGKKESNIHMSIPGEAKSIIIDADREQLAEISDNVVYKNAWVSTRAKMNPVTGEYKDYRLEKLVIENSEFPEELFNKLREEGKEAWKDVTDPVRWVEEQRGIEE